MMGEEEKCLHKKSESFLSAQQGYESALVLSLPSQEERCLVPRARDSHTSVFGCSDTVYADLIMCSESTALIDSLGVRLNAAYCNKLTDNKRYTLISNPRRSSTPCPNDKPRLAIF